MTYYNDSLGQIRCYAKFYIPAALILGVLVW